MDAKYFEKASLLLGLDENDVREAYMYYWKCIRDSVSNAKIPRGLDEDAFNEAIVNCSITKIGKLCCTYKQYVNELKRRDYLTGKIKKKIGRND